ncbi:MAG: helix-turn-helix domain-containing protein [Thermoguttaceae bacterium]|jgi:excisionase family DNA binding protein
MRKPSKPKYVPIVDSEGKYLVDALWPDIEASVKQHIENERRKGIPLRPSFTIRQTAQLTGLSVAELRKLIATEAIKAHITGGSWFIPREEVLQLMPQPAEDSAGQAGPPHF